MTDRPLSDHPRSHLSDDELDEMLRAEQRCRLRLLLLGPMPIDPHALYVGWKAIAQALQVSEQVARRYRRREGLPVALFFARPEMVAGRRQGGRVQTTGAALLEWATARAKGRDARRWAEEGA